MAVMPSKYKHTLSLHWPCITDWLVQWQPVYVQEEHGTIKLGQRKPPPRRIQSLSGLGIRTTTTV